MAKRVYNFGGGPAMMPEEILRQAQDELLNWQQSGMSVMEVSHRSVRFADLMAEAEQDLRDLLAIPANYRVLFLAGPARAQFAMVPMNLLRGKKQVDYIETGIWSQLAAEEARRYAKVNLAASAENTQFTSVPARSSWRLDPDAAYVYYTINETVNGVALHDIPATGEVPLVTDATSYLLTKPMDISRFGLVFAGSQKNIAPSGLTIVIVREDLIGDTLTFTPTIFDYQKLAKMRSLYYTPTSFSCYMAALMFRWLKAQGGLAEMEKINQRKAQTLYDFIDSSDFYYNKVAVENRSLCNIPFQLQNETLTATFLEEATNAQLAALKGHRFVGGMRASLYNAMPQAGVDALVDFMQNFAHRHA